DGIRDFHVTGVQTCALPISRKALRGDDMAEINAAQEELSKTFSEAGQSFYAQSSADGGTGSGVGGEQPADPSGAQPGAGQPGAQIGRASGRERVSMSVVRVW